MNNKLTDERPDDEGLELLITIRREIAERHASEGRMEQCAVHTLILNALLELQERRKADSDPVGEFYEDGTLNWYQISDGDRVPANRRIPLYRHAQPVPEREQIRREHAEWSDATFGDVGPIGPLKHLSKEALEAAAEPGDLSEWSDMQFLLWDVLRRAGNTPVQSPIDHGYRPECECSGCKATARICAELNNEEAEIFADGYNAAMQSFGNSEQLNSPVTPDGWISCSERMPDSKTGVLVAREFGRKGDWRMKWGTYIPGHPDAQDGWIIPGASWLPTHWMPMPEPPQQ